MPAVLKVEEVGATEPVTLAEAKAQARVDISTDDDLLSLYITAARQSCEIFCRREFIDRTYTWYLDNFPGDMVLRFPRTEVNAVNSVSYYDTNGDLQVVSDTLYTFDPNDLPQKLWLNHGEEWPLDIDTDRLNAVQIEFTTAGTCPSTVKAAILMLVAHWYENREAVVVGSGVNELPAAHKMLLINERRMEADYAPLACR